MQIFIKISLLHIFILIENVMNILNINRDTQYYIDYAIIVLVVFHSASRLTYLRKTTWKTNNELNLSSFKHVNWKQGKINRNNCNIFCVVVIQCIFKDWKIFRICCFQEFRKLLYSWKILFDYASKRNCMKPLQSNTSVLFKRLFYL